MRARALLVLLAACSAAPAASAPDAAPPTSPDAPTRELDAAHDAPAVELDAPPHLADATPDAPAPVDPRPALVLLLHGVGANGAAESVYWDAPALAGSAVVLAPNEPYRTNWDASDACCDPDPVTHDDATMLAELVAARVAQGDVNPRRVFAFGHSNGAFMVWRLLCDHADVFTAGVMLEGAANSATDPACAPSRPIRVLHVHGTADPTITWAAPGQLSEMGSDGFATMPGIFPAAIGPGGSLDQESTAAGCTDVLRPVGKVDSGIEQSDGTAADVDGFTRDCAGTADLWRVNGGIHTPVLGPAWIVNVFRWAVQVTP